MHALLRDAKRDSDVALLRLHDRRVAGDLDQVRARVSDEEILLREIADRDVRVAVLPLQVVRVDVRFLLIGRRAVAITPPALRGADAVGVRRRWTDLHLHAARLGERSAAVARIVDAMNVAFEAQLPVVADAALNADCSASEAGCARRLIGHAGHRDHLALQARNAIVTRRAGSDRNRWRRHRIIELAKDVRRQRSTQLPDFLVRILFRVLSVVEAKREFVVGLCRNDHRHRRRETGLDGDDAIDGRRQERQ